MKTLIIALAKMEELYVREWIDWHRSIGIDHIVIGDNNYSDYEHQLQPIIQDYIDEGYVSIIDIKNRHKIQLEFYNDAYHKYYKDYDWLSFIDLDEFIYCPKYDNDIKKLLSEVEKHNFNALVFPWMNMTANKKLRYDDGLVQERFTEPHNQNIVSTKYFIKASPDIFFINSRHCPDMITCINDYKIVSCDTIFGREDFNWFINDKGTKKFTMMKRNKEHENSAYIKHYITKSLEEFVDYKLFRGRSSEKSDKRYDFHFFKRQQNYDKKFIQAARTMYAKFINC